MKEQRIALMPLEKNVSRCETPPPDDWELQDCPLCGQKCYYQKESGEMLKALFSDTVFMCTECALKEQSKKER